MLSRRDSNTQRVAALDALARALKLKPGMGVGEACAMHPNIEVVEAEPEADRRLLEGLSDWCDRYTPLVALDGTDGLFLDITGCAHLFGGERGMMDDLLSRFFHQGFEIRAGLASTPGAAWAAARFGGDLIVAPGEEEELLAPLPLAALRLPSEIRGGLESVGLRTSGAIMSAPRAPLVRRFGKEVVLRLDQALGRVQEAISPRLPVPPLSTERPLSEPIVRLDDIEALVALLSRQLKIDLERRGEGAERLQLSLFRVDGAVSRITVGASRPVREPKLIQKLFHERLTALEMAIDAGYGFDLVRLSVLVVASLDAAQPDFDGGLSDPAADIALFADRVRARLGDGAVRQPYLVESHIPERAVVSEPCTRFSKGSKPVEKIVPASRQRVAKDRPIRLFSPPEWVEVTFEAAVGQPSMRFEWRRASYRVVRSEGPERIAPEWWRDQTDAAARDYFRVEDEEGRRYWIYRQNSEDMPDTSPRWFMQGVFP
ncbi:DNA polymerase Y family protein [Mesorhizobium sp. LHD-90]|uniref:Y-family DNA polymerase n=1 Tax=Mesorhizobium sp. LHD-90 TaxID=3071414 RepID=UPI0027DF4692|nr:DNA polymerase Y family protein [Mesorhizobium sp. LHD-90]MDQ6434138.1 DNA polymerase Y family protein [Mesorhizobium sp. LHD-90]